MSIDIKIKNLEEPGHVGELIKRDSLIPSDVNEVVEEILAHIRDGDKDSLIEYSGKLEGFTPVGFEGFRVTDEELEIAYNKVKVEKPELAEAIDASRHNIEKFHQEQKNRQETYWSINSGKGGYTAQIISPIERIGVYVPGGRFPYPSTVLMAAVPAKIAGCSEISFFTPPGRDGSIDEVILYAVRSCGLNEVYKIGGAQAVAVMAYGLGDIKKVDKIVGPGNIYVTAAKKAVFGEVGIDSLAGPSEVLIITDKTGIPDYIASDLISQAEHDPDALVILLSEDLDVAQKSIEALGQQLVNLSSNYGKRFASDRVEKTLNDRCIVIYDDDIDRLIEASNIIAPEHLEIMVKDTESVLKKIKNAGAIFIGDHSPVAIGDYFCGTNHVIPTRGNARFASPLGIHDFTKRSSIASYNEVGLDSARKYIEIFSDTENLLAHKESVKKRFEEREND